MRKFLTALDMCVHMFISIPLPPGKWDDGLRRHSTACLPLVGLLIGAIWLGIAALVRALLPAYLAAALAAAYPFLITGFIHLDGFMDTGDAILSWRDREEKLRILKDVHVGSFAVVLLVLLCMFQFAACMSIGNILPLLLVPVLSRTGSAFCVLRLKPLGHSEYAAHADETPRALSHIVLCMAAASLVLLAVLCGWRGLLVGAVTLLAYAACMARCVKSLGGVSGDLAGFSLTVSELCGLIAMAIV